MLIDSELSGNCGSSVVQCPGKLVRIGVIGARTIPNSYGGFERFIELLVNHPSWLGTPFHFVVYCESPSKELNPVTTIRQLKSRKSQNGLGYYGEGAWFAARECDIVLALGIGVSIFGIIPQLWRKPLIVNSGGVGWKKAKWSMAARMANHLLWFTSFLFSNRVVIDAEALRPDYMGLFQKRMTYVAYQATPPEPNADNAALVAGLGVDGHFMLIIARLEGENNIEMMVDGFVRSGITDQTLIVVGATNTAYYEETLKPKHAPNVRFVGGIFDQKVLNALRMRCSVYLHGHTLGGSPPSLIEALAAIKGRLFSHNNKYNREVAGDRAQYFTNADELAALIKATPAEIPDPAKAPRFNDERFDPAFIAEGYRRIFQELLER